MKQIFLTCFLMVSLIGMAQEQLNDYKYIIVPKKFEGFKKTNQYQTSTLVKFLLTEKGFLAVYEDELPDDLNNNRCLGLTANLLDDSSMFTTKAAVALENCNGQEVFATKQGKSKEKDFKMSYGAALREAFTSFDTMNYSYNGKAENTGPVTVSFKNDVKTMDADNRKDSASAKKKDAMVQQEATQENQSYVDKRPVESNYKKADEKKEMVRQEATQEQQSYTDKAPRASDMKKAASAVMSKGSMGTLYAQELPNGYQLVDSSPKIRLKLFKSSMSDFYLAEAGDTNGVVFEKNGKWFFEYYSGENLMSEELDIKF